MPPRTQRPGGAQHVCRNVDTKGDIVWKRLAVLTMLIGASFGVGPGLAVSSPVPSWTPPDLAEVQSHLEGLSWDDFVETSYRLYVLRFPETVTRMGMAAEFGVRNDRLNDYSDAYVRETMAIESDILLRLRAFDRSALSPSQQVVYDACEWYWDDLVRAHPFLYCDYPVSHLFVTSVDQLVQELLTEIHPLVKAADAEDYVLRLEQLGSQFDGILDGLDRRARAGVILPQRILDWAIYGVQQMASSSAAACPYLVRLRAALPAIGDLASTDAQVLERRAETAIGQSVLPAYQRLVAKLAELRRTAPEIGIWRVPDGAAYYEHLLRHFTGVELSAAEIHETGLREVARVQAEIRSCAATLGYPVDMLSIAELFAAIERDGGALVDNDILLEYERLIESAKVRALAFLPSLPTTDVVVEPDPVGGFYRSAPRDGSLPAAFGAQTTGTQPWFTMPTLAYHETIPGHHVQIALAQEMDLPLLLSETGFLGFNEGWALYAERLAWESGWYESDPCGNLGRLQFELMRAGRLVVDTGIHAMGWGYSEAVAYYQGATGRSPQLAQADVYRYAAWPGQAVSYTVGYLKLLELREAAKAALGAKFDLASFHRALLGWGNLPLGVAVKWVKDTIAREEAAP